MTPEEFKDRVKTKTANLVFLNIASAGVFSLLWVHRTTQTLNAMPGVKPISDLLAIWMSVCMGFALLFLTSFGVYDMEVLAQLFSVIDAYPIEALINFILLPEDMGPTETRVVREIYSTLSVHPGISYVSAVFSVFFASFGYFLLAVLSLLFIVWAFKARALLMELAPRAFAVDLKMNWFYTFFFTTFYVNYCINDLPKMAGKQKILREAAMRINRERGGA